MQSGVKEVEKGESDLRTEGVYVSLYLDYELSTLKKNTATIPHGMQLTEDEGSSFLKSRLGIWEAGRKKTLTWKQQE